MTTKKTRKITILGAGNVGATIAYCIMQQGLVEEILLVDINKEKAHGEVLDLLDGASFCSRVKIWAGDYADAVNSDVVIVTLGAGRKPGQSRIDLAAGNVSIIKSIIPKIEDIAPNAVYIIVSNPVDILTYTFHKFSTRIPKNNIIGSGTLLDTSRLRAIIAGELNIDPNMVDACLFGEHGDTSMIPWSLANISGIQIDKYYKKYNIALKKNEILKKVRVAGGEIIKRKGATFYAIGLSVARICEYVLKDQKAVIPLSTLVKFDNIGEVCLSVPCKIGIDGIEDVFIPKITGDEQKRLSTSAKALKDVISAIPQLND